MRILWLVALLACFINASEKVSIFATCIDSNTTSIKATSNVLVLYDGYYLSADEAYYNKDSTLLELFGSVVAMRGDQQISMGEYASIDMNTNAKIIKPFFLLDRNQSVWISSKRASADDDYYSMRSGSVSGCDPTDPLWKIEFSSADYSSKTRWMNLYNARLNFYGLPLFYLPYLGYSLDDRRRSGLLIPFAGLSSEEGIYYEQPIYVALEPDWDVELRPQIRTDRGVGIYTTLRFVDSNASGGSLRVGYFREKKSYADRIDLANIAHYGFDFNYEDREFLRESLTLKSSSQSGLYADVSLMNDIAYINLSSNDKTKNATSNQILSRVNLFYNDKDEYYGANLRYYLDLTKKSNSDTLQSLPSLRYHRYIKTFLHEYLYYTFNAKATNLYRPEGKNALYLDMDLPITLQTSLLDEWLQLSYSAQLNGKYITFQADAPESNVISKSQYNTALFARFYHNIDVATSASKKYDEFVHTLGFEASYSKAGIDYSSGYYEDKKEICNRVDASSNFECDFYSITQVEEAVDLHLTQFVSDSSNRQILYHRLSQRLSLDPLKERLSELENEIDLYITPNLTLYSDLFFNYQRSLLSKLISSIRYNSKELQAGWSAMYEDIESEDGSRYTNYTILDFAYQHNDQYRYFASYAYDLELRVQKYLEAGFSYTKRCWKFGLKYVENNRPILTQNRASSVYDRYLYISVELSPIGGTQMSYKLDRR